MELFMPDTYEDRTYGFSGNDGKMKLYVSETYEAYIYSAFSNSLKAFV
jgi:hypothetical protein